MAQLRFYDERQVNLLKFIFTLTSAVSGGLLAIYQLFDSVTPEFHICLAFLAMVVFIASVLTFLSMLQNRLYFVFTARQINALRNHLLLEEASEFTSNQLYTTTRVVAIKPFSVHTYLMVGVALIASMFAGVFVYGIGSAIAISSLWHWIGASLLSVTVVLMFFGYRFLAVQGQKVADSAVHQNSILPSEPKERASAE